MTKYEAKKIIKEELAKHGLTNKLTAKTIDFTDLAGESCIFVTIHNWKLSPIHREIQQTAKANGFFVEFAHN